MIFVDDCLNRAFYKEKALVAASSVNVKLREGSFPALVMNHFVFILDYMTGNLLLVPSLFFAAE